MVLADVDETKAQEAVKELRLAGYEAVCVVGDALGEVFPVKAVDAASQGIQEGQLSNQQCRYTTLTISPYVQR